MGMYLYVYVNVYEIERIKKRERDREERGKDWPSYINGWASYLYVPGNLKCDYSEGCPFSLKGDQWHSSLDIRIANTVGGWANCWMV